MGYLKPVILALAAAIALGVLVGAYDVLGAAVRGLSSADKAAVLSQGISEGMNCTALFALVLVPAALGLAYFRRGGR